MIKKPLEVVYLVDASSSVSGETMALFKSFIKSSLAGYQISNSGTRASVVTFGERATITLPLTEGGNLQRVLQAIDGLENVGGIGRLDIALQKVYDSVLTQEAGLRAGAGKVVIAFIAIGNRPISGQQLLSFTENLKDQNTKISIIAVRQQGSSSTDYYLENIGNLVDNMNFIDIVDLPSVFPGVLVTSGLASGSFSFTFSMTDIYVR